MLKKIGSFFSGSSNPSFCAPSESCKKASIVWKFSVLQGKKNSLPSSITRRLSTTFEGRKIVRAQVLSSRKLNFNKLLKK